MLLVYNKDDSPPSHLITCTDRESSACSIPECCGVMTDNRSRRPSCCRNTTFYRRRIYRGADMLARRNLSCFGRSIALQPNEVGSDVECVVDVQFSHRGTGPEEERASYSHLGNPG